MVVDPESRRVVVVTGSSQGIGRAVALAFGQAGYAVVINGRHAERLQPVAAELDAAGVSVLAVDADVRSWDQVEAMAAKVAEAFGRVDVLVNNAGGNFPCPLEEITPRGWQAVLDTNLTSAFYCAKAYFPLLRTSRGCIVNVASVAGLGAHPLRAHYAAAKAGLINLTRCMAAEWGKYGIRANAVAPGAIWTQASRYNDPTERGVAAERTPLGRVGQPEEVAAVCLHLASEVASYISGAVVRIDGGPRPAM